jgi:hypothetical protein
MRRVRGLSIWSILAPSKVFAYGDASFYGSTGDLKLNAPIVGIAASENGYRILGGDGGVFAYGVPYWGGSPVSSTPFVGIAS